MERIKGDLVGSFDSAFRGLIYVLKVERNFRVHLAVAALVIIGSLFLNLPLTEFLILLLIVTLVLVTELINTLVEMIVDSLVKEYHINAKRIKDVGAAVVMVAAVFAAMIGYLILAKHFPPVWRNGFENIANSPWYVTFIALIIIVMLSILLKFILKQDSLLTGGMPSIHSAVSFSILTIVSFLTWKEQPIIPILVLLLAVWIAQSRVARKIHRLEEVVIGAVLGIMITLIMIQIFWR